MTTFIIGAGNCDNTLIRDTITAIPADERLIVACDRGLITCLELGINPDFCIGDFDSAPDGTYERAMELGLKVTKLNPIKDDTDSEAALSIAMNEAEGDIVFFGGTGSRLDHVLGNMALLGRALDNGRHLYLMDTTNKIYMIGGGSRHTILRDKQYGKYVSVIPYMGEVKGLTMKGFKYPLENATVSGFNTLTISNEITDNQAVIELSEGYLIVLETRD